MLSAPPARQDGPGLPQPQPWGALQSQAWQQVAQSHPTGVSQGQRGPQGLGAPVNLPCTDA